MHSFRIKTCKMAHNIMLQTIPFYSTFTNRYSASFSVVTLSTMKSTFLSLKHIGYAPSIYRGQTSEISQKRNMLCISNKHDGDWMCANRLSFDKHSGDTARFMHTCVLRRYRLRTYRCQDSAQCITRTDPPSPRVLANAMSMCSKLRSF